MRMGDAPSSVKHKTNFNHSRTGSSLKWRCSSPYHRTEFFRFKLRQTTVKKLGWKETTLIKTLCLGRPGNSKLRLLFLVKKQPKKPSSIFVNILFTMLATHKFASPLDALRGGEHRIFQVEKCWNPTCKWTLSTEHFAFLPFSLGKKLQQVDSK